jgi:hypothetical protein
VAFWGWRRAAPAEALLRMAVPVAAFGLLLAIVTGAALFSAEASQYVRNAAFLTKQGLIALGLINIAWFHWALRPAAAAWPHARAPERVRMAAGVSAIIWIGTLVCGRMIAYVG